MGRQGVVVLSDERRRSDGEIYIVWEFWAVVNMVSHVYAAFRCIVGRSFGCVTN